MCGIVGIVSNCANGFSAKEMAMFSNLLFLDTVRGFDSTGVFGVSNNRNVVIHKEAVHGLDFLSTKEFKEFKAEMIQHGKFVVGHNRAATRGTIVDKNAHPFWVDDKIVLVQNGTYKGSHKDLKDTEVDTEAVAHVISESATVEEALQKINASYALVWYNAETSELNLIRNSERPLWIASYHGTGLMFASEPIMLEYAAKREDVKMDTPVQIPEHMHVIIKLNGKGGYERTDTKIDAAYRFSKGTGANDWDEAEWYNNVQGYGNIRQQAIERQVACAYPSSANDHRPGGKDDIKHTFATHMQSREEYLFPTEAAAIADLDAVNNACYQGHHYIEMIDYVAANDHRNCTAWHVYGAVISDSDPNSPCTLVHWLEFNKEEADILEMCTASFYKCKLSTTISRKIITAKGESKWLNTTFASSHEEMVGVPAQ